MPYEMNCKWHFAAMSENAGDEGPNSAMSQTFAQFPCAALVRESIQNSLDAAIDNGHPVKVCFEYRILFKNDYPNFFTLSDHIVECKNYYSLNRSANAIYPAMKDYLGWTNSVGFIRVSDYNTKGMDYTQDETDKTFYAFVRAAGVSVKQAEGAGGSFGFGKGAFFVMSPLNTLMVSTRTLDGECFFEGVSRLCTHRIDGEKRSHMGFYDNNDGQPTSNPDRIPTPFKREKSGTSIGIMGIKQENWIDAIPELTKEVLRNFMVSILKGKLIVIIDGNDDNNNRAIVINQTTIDSLMKQYFPSTKDSRTKGPYNPRPYFEAMTASDANVFRHKLPVLGDVELHVKEFEDNVTQFVFMRKLLMKVSRSSRSLGNYNGVFICENETGNKILCDMEDPEHKSWDPELCKKKEVKTSYETACAAEKEIEMFINDCLEELLNINASESVQVSGLEKYLPSLVVEKGKGEKGNPFTGKPTGRYVNDGASLTTEGSIKEVKRPSGRRKGNVAEIDTGRVKRDDDSNEHFGTGGNRGGGGGTPGPGDNWKKGLIEEGEGKFKRLVEVDWRPVLSTKAGCTDIVLYSPKEISSAELQFQIGRESKAKKCDEDVSIVSSNKGHVNGLKITDVQLRGNAKNIIQVSFSDKMYHALILDVYETD